MKRILRASALVGCIGAAVWMTSLAPTSNNCAYAQRTLVQRQTVVYYSGYGQGYYGGYVPSYSVPSYSGTYVFVPNNGYTGYVNGAYGYYSGYGNRGYYDPNYRRVVGASPYPYRLAPGVGYFRGY